MKQTAYRTMPDMSLEDYLTVSQAAERLGIHPDALRIQCLKGRIASELFGPRCRMIKKTEVERYASEQLGKKGRKTITPPGTKPKKKPKES